MRAALRCPRCRLAPAAATRASRALVWAACAAVLAACTAALAGGLAGAYALPLRAASVPAASTQAVTGGLIAARPGSSEFTGLAPKATILPGYGTVSAYDAMAAVAGDAPGSTPARPAPQPRKARHAAGNGPQIAAIVACTLTVLALIGCATSAHLISRGRIRHWRPPAHRWQ